MAAMTTVLEEFSDKENSRTFALSGHTVQAPQLVIQKRKVAATSTASQESVITVIYGTSDSAGDPLQSKVAISSTVRYPVNGDAADVSAALVVFRDIIASDEFTDLVNSQKYVA
jgi:hypothetical protein